VADTLPPIVVALRATIGDFKAKMGEAAAETKSFGDKSKSNFDAVGQVGKVALAGIAGGALAIGGESLKMGISFQEATTRLTTGAGESEANLEMVRQGILKMAPAVGQGPEALATAMFTVESAGYHGADGLAVMQAAAEGAKIGGADMTVMANGLTTAMTDYHIPTAQAADVTSKLIETVSRGKTTMGDLSASLSAVLPTAAAAGVGLDQVMGAMATMTGEGISAQQSAQDLSSTISSLSAPTAVMSKAMGQLGINSTDLSANMGKIGLTGTLQTLSDTITSQMGPDGLVLQDSLNQSKLAAQSAATMIKSLPEPLQAVATAYQAGTTTAKDYAAAFKGQDSVTADLGKQFKKTADQANGFSQQLKSGKGAAATYNAEMSAMTGGVTGLHVALALTGENQATFDDNVKGIGEAAQQADGHVKGWAETQADLGTKIDQAKAGVQAMGVSIGMALIPWVEKAITIGTEWMGYLKDHQGLLIGLAGVIGGGLAVAIAAYVAHLAMAAGKTVVEFAKMIGAGVKWVAEHTVQLATWIAQSTAAFATWVAEQTASVAESAALWAMYAAEWIAEQSATLATWVAESAASAAEWVATQAAALVESAVSAAVWSASILAASAAAVAGWLVDMAVMVASSIASAAAIILPFLPLIVTIGAIGIAAYELYTHWDQVWGFIKQIASDVWDFLKGVFDALVQGGLWVIKTEVQGLETVWSAVWSGIQSAVSGVWGFLKGIFDDIVQGGLWVVKTEIQGFETVWNTVWNGIQSTVSAVWSVISGIFGSISGAISGVMGAIGSIASAASGVGSVLGALHIPGFAGGVTNFSGGFAMVGEEGPELVKLPGGSDVIPTPAVMAMSGTGRTLPSGGGGGSPSSDGVHVHFHGPVYGGPSGMQEVAEMIRTQLLQTKARSGSLGLA
jgi:TP901 family phage tail tape measure protein